MPKRKVGLALSSGVARGLAHVGVLEVLEREGIPVDIIAGTSVGALAGAVYARDKNAGGIRNLAIELSSRMFSLLVDPTLSKSGLIRGRRIEAKLKSVIGDLEFRDLKMPFACVATDIDNGDEVVISDGPVWQGLRATISLPVLLSVAKWRDRYLVDGVLVNPVPVNVVRAMGANFVIAVNVIPHRSIREPTEPNIFSVMMQTLHIVAHHMVQSSFSGADIIIEPEVGHIAYTDFHRAEECIRQGELAAQESIAEIKRKYSSRFRDTLAP